MARTNLPTDILRTFLMVVDLESFTRAGEMLGRSQPAISLQMRRLEELLGAKLIHVVGRRLEITEDGRALALYARQILQLNDQAVDRFIRRPRNGTLRVGLPTDYSVAFLQRAMTDFAHVHPEVRLEIVCDLSQRLLDDLRKDDLDIVIAMTCEGLRQYLAREWVERPCWAAAKSWTADPTEPVPLVVHPEGCEYRHRMVQALGAAQREWRIAYSSPGITGLQNAVAAGLGVSALTQRTLTDEMRVLTEEEGFPTLTDIRVGLYYKHPRQSDHGLMLVNHVIARLDASDEADFARVRRYRQSSGRREIGSAPVNRKCRGSQQPRMIAGICVRRRSPRCWTRSNTSAVAAFVMGCRTPAARVCGIVLQAAGVRRPLT